MSVNATIREIDQRSNDGITVTLSGHFNYDGMCEFCIVNVESPTETFTINEIPLDRAADVYHHPFVYAERLLNSGRLAA